METEHDKWNDLVYKLAARAKELANMPLDALRSTANGYGVWSKAEAIRDAKQQRLSRGELVEMELIETFIKEII